MNRYTTNRDCKKIIQLLLRFEYMHYVCMEYGLCTKKLHNRPHFFKSMCICTLTLNHTTFFYYSNLHDMFIWTWWIGFEYMVCSSRVCPLYTHAVLFAFRMPCQIIKKVSSPLSLSQVKWVRYVNIFISELRSKTYWIAV